jgi:F0F1-type ATP synthase delta subunit
MTLGSYLRNFRLSQRISLRNFCENNNLDPLIWSKVERDLLISAPTDDDLNKIIKLYCLDENKSLKLLKKLVKQTSYNVTLSEKELIDKLPVIINKKLSDNQLNKLAKSITESFMPYAGNIFDKLFD